MVTFSDSSSRRRSHGSSSRTYSRAAFLAAQEAWATGDFGPEWDAWRRRAADLMGVISPPAGTRWDSIEDEEPSQRAIIWRAITDTPKLLEDAMRRSTSWSGVIAVLFRWYESRREDADLDEREAAWHKQGEPGHSESVMALANVIRRIGDSI